ncbi:hypothetical protein [Streptomyces zingiberis]|uniref:Uncharacterized protein n=1 Tax=Streptomyces zingiberis TaxID=2053010 RepID=A0ABX1BU44_9ACTN|nr:hypothetical protein [Streptomyces zingiberis]NJQ00065.1 hypothetical protein [Streptomyces zingiberis]
MLPTPSPEPADTPATDGPPAHATVPERTGVSASPGSRTARLLTAAAVLGVLTGTVAGYTVQYDRPPTPLPPLSRPELHHPAPAASAGGRPATLPADQDPPPRTEGDLRELLLQRPEGAASVPGRPDGERLTQLAYAHEFTQAGHEFTLLIRHAFRRAAGVDWVTGERHVTVRLVQFDDSEWPNAAQYLNGRQQSVGADPEVGDNGLRIPGTATGSVHVHRKPVLMDARPIHRAQALARRGDTVVDIRVSDTEPIAARTVMSLAERQLERL